MLVKLYRLDEIWRPGSEVLLDRNVPSKRYGHNNGSDACG